MDIDRQSLWDWYFIQGIVPWDEDAPVSDNLHIVVCSFMPGASGPMSTYRTCSTDYRLYVGDNLVQLFEKQRTNTFVFITRPPAASGADVITSIALQKISATVQKVGYFQWRSCAVTHRFAALAMRAHLSFPGDRDRASRRVKQGPHRTSIVRLAL